MHLIIKHEMSKTSNEHSIAHKSLCATQEVDTGLETVRDYDANDFIEIPARWAVASNSRTPPARKLQKTSLENCLDALQRHLRLGQHLNFTHFCAFVPRRSFGAGFG